MNKLSKEQKKQDNQYEFPYHYVSKFRTDFTQTFNDPWGINYASTIEFIIDQLRKENFETLLDIGCGDGRLTKEILFDLPNKNIIGVDYSERAISLAKALSPEARYVCGDIITSNIVEADVCTLIEVFEHIPPETSNDFVAGVSRQLKKGGVLLLTVPHQNIPLIEKHYRHFDTDLLFSCFSNDFNIVKIKPFEQISLMRNVINRLLTNRFFILNSRKLKNYLYKYYKEKLFDATSENLCQRLFMKAIKK
ncbi:MAG: class I SAM-dependent methyltransferase [Acholeplasma sp.]